MATDKFLHERLYRGKQVFERLEAATVTVCGAGALGSNVVMSLARTGFKNLRVIDRDRVDAHNLSCQDFAEKDVGALKANALKARVFAAVGVEVVALAKELTEGNSKTLLREPGIVVDIFDNQHSRRLVQQHVRTYGLPCLHAGLFEDYGEVVWDEHYRVPQDSAGDVCDYPLARSVVMLTVAVACEEILDFVLADNPRKKDWTITLKDLCIQERE